MALDKRWVRAAVAAMIAALLYLPGLGRPALWEPDEGRYAEIAREMVLSGDYITPRDNFVRYFEKPPLVYWMEAAAIHVFGPSEFAVRLPAAMLTTAEVAVTEVAGEAMFGASAGFMGAVALALSPLVFAFARFATLDPALAFFLTAAVGAFYFASRAQDFASGAGRAWMLGASAMLAMGTLTKGPIALVLGGVIALIWILIEHRGREIRRMPLVGCSLVYLALVLPWFVIAESRNPGFIRFFVVHEHLRRFFSSSEHGWGPYFFVPVVIGGAWPWLYFVPAGISSIASASPERRQQEKSALRLLVAWFAVIFVLFSIPRSKLGSYMLPAMPPIAVIAGVALSRIATMGRERVANIARGFVLINAIAAAIAIVVLWAIRDRIGAMLAADGALIAATIALGSIAAGMLLSGGFRPGRAFAAIALAMALTTRLGERARAAAGAFTTYRQLAAQARRYSGCEIGSYRHYVQSMPFYTGRREILVQYWGELAPFAHTPEERAGFIGSAAKFQELWGSDKCVLLIANRRDLPELTRVLVPAPRVVGCEGKKLILYNRDPEDRPPDCGSGAKADAAASAVLGNRPDGL